MKLGEIDVLISRLKEMYSDEVGKRLNGPDYKEPSIRENTLSDAITVAMAYKTMMENRIDELNQIIQNLNMEVAEKNVRNRAYEHYSNIYRKG